jgi:hypothetical protein
MREGSHRRLGRIEEAAAGQASGEAAAGQASGVAIAAGLHGEEVTAEAAPTGCRCRGCSGHPDGLHCRDAVAAVVEAVSAAGRC